MSIQDPPFGDRPASEPQRDDSLIPAGDAAKLRDAGSTVRQDLNAAFETARNDLRSAADTAKRDLGAAKDEAVNQLQSLRGQAGGNAQSLKSQAADGIHGLTDQAQALASQAQDGIQSLRGQAESQISDAASRVKAYASEQTDQLTTQARTFANEQKDLAARQVTGVADAVARIADELQSSQNGTAVAGYVQNLAGSLRDVADSFERKSVDDLFNDVQTFGRRQPLAFLGVAALAGFAASRFILASRQRTADAAARPEADRDFDREVTQRQNGRRRRTEVELDRSATAGETVTPARGMGDNGRI